MAKERRHILVQMLSGRIVQAELLPERRGEMPLVTWAGLPPFPAIPLSSQDIVDVEAGRAVASTTG